MNKKYYYIVGMVSVFGLSACGTSDGTSAGANVLKGSASKAGVVASNSRVLQLLNFFENAFEKSAWAFDASLCTWNAASPYCHIGKALGLKVTFKHIYISQKADCSDAIKIADFGPSGREFNMDSAPTLASLEGLPNGTYRCLKIGLSTVMAFTPAASSIANFTGCAAGGGGERLVNLATQKTVADRSSAVFMDGYFTTDVTQVPSGSQAVLDNTLTVPTNGPMAFYMDTTNTVTSQDTIHANTQACPSPTTGDCTPNAVIGAVDNTNCLPDAWATGFIASN